MFSCPSCLFNYACTITLFGLTKAVLEEVALLNKVD